MPGYREQIVESQAQKLARERSRYQRAWRRFRWSEWVPKTMLAGFGLLTLASVAAWALFLLDGLLVSSTSLFLAGTLCVASGLMGPLTFVTTIAALARRNLVRCPRCGERFSLKLRWRDLYIATGGDQCRHCYLPLGYLPTAEDLKDDEPGAG